VEQHPHTRQNLSLGPQHHKGMSLGYTCQVRWFMIRAEGLRAKVSTCRVLFRASDRDCCAGLTVRAQHHCQANRLCRRSRVPGMAWWLRCVRQFKS
jgi:hypothetical protein